MPYKHKEKASERHKEYYCENKDVILSQTKKYKQTPEGIASSKKYQQSVKGKLAHARKVAKRKNFNLILMFPNPFTENVKIDWHHITNAYVVAIPRDLHQMYAGKFHREKVMEIAKQIYLGK